MTTFEDLTPFELGDDLGPAQHVGWLGRDVPYSTGQVDPQVINCLVRLAAKPANLTRGVHHCDFCDVDSPIPLETPYAPKGRLWLGNGEIHIPGPDGVLFAAPTLIIHYILGHDYRPPDVFSDAVLASN